MIGIKIVWTKSSLALGLLLALTGCEDSASEQKPLPGAKPQIAAPPQSQAATERKMTRQEQVIYCHSDLAESLKLEPEEVSLSGATPVTWRSGALGCPEPGMNYTQALVPGIWIMMKAGNKAYRYHAAQGGQPFYCPDERAEPPVTGPGAD